MDLFIDNLSLSVYKIEFWIGILGLIFSALAFWQAMKAKNAALNAGKTVKIQGVIVDLTEISYRLEEINHNISFTEARRLLSEISRKLIKSLAPFKNSNDISEIYNNLRLAILETTDELQKLEPSNGDIYQVPKYNVYFALHRHFSNINNFVAEITGLLEARNIGATKNG